VVANADELRRVLVNLSRNDWPFGRWALCLPPSLGGAEDVIEAKTRWVLGVLEELEVGCAIAQ
jgi:hypothetical protein